MSTRIHHAPLALAKKPLRRPRMSSLMSLLGLARQRRALAELDSKALNDIGLTREAALREAERPIWDVPTYWSNKI